MIGDSMYLLLIDGLYRNSIAARKEIVEITQLLLAASET